MASEDTEWDRVWAEFDDRGGKPLRAADGPPLLAKPRMAMVLLLTLPVLALGGSLAATMLVTVARPAPPPRVLSYSLAPDERDMPPLAQSLGRLAAQSSSASCWAAQLQPSGSSCALAAGAR